MSSHIVRRTCLLLACARARIAAAPDAMRTEPRPYSLISVFNLNACSCIGAAEVSRCLIALRRMRGAVWRLRAAHSQLAEASLQQQRFPRAIRQVLSIERIYMNLYAIEPAHPSARFHFSCAHVPHFRSHRRFASRGRAPKGLCRKRGGSLRWAARQSELCRTTPIACHLSGG